MTQTSSAPAGWYDDGRGGERFWDGLQWTDQVRPVEVTASSSVSPFARRKNVLGIVALIVAVVGFVFACVPGALIVGWVLLPASFILSIAAFFVKGPKWSAVTGLIVAVVGTIVGIIVFVGLAATSFSDAFEESTGTTVGEAPEVAPADQAAPEAAPPAAAGSRENPVPLGTPISGSEFTVMINSISLGANDAVMAANMFNEAPAAGFSYAVVNYSVTYTGSESGYAAAVSVDFVADTGEVYTAADAMAVAPEPDLGFDELYNGGVVTGNSVLALPDGVPGQLRVRPGYIADEVFVAIP